VVEAPETTAKKPIEKILIILDLDETLIHATDKPHDDAWDFEVFHYKVYKRPYLQEFYWG
jgi:RNA polymerase II subunit A small phosphatase-like protein